MRIKRCTSDTWFWWVVLSLVVMSLVPRRSFFLNMSIALLAPIK